MLLNYGARPAEQGSVLLDNGVWIQRCNLPSMSTHREPCKTKCVYTGIPDATNISGGIVRSLRTFFIFWCVIIVLTCIIYGIWPGLALF